MRVIVLGGTGNFGARICRALQGNSATEVICASRRPAPASALRQLQTAVLNIDDAHFEAQLRALTPQLVIHCVGPYQGQDYRVAKASLAAGAHYLDLADGRSFVAQFQAAVDNAARAAGRTAISGASTLPALSSAVIDALSTRLSRMESIDIAIAPGQRAPRGAATLEAVFSYLGRPFKWWKQGRWVKAHGWQELKRLQFDCGERWGAACDVPDLELLPQRYPQVHTVEFRAALELRVQHLFLWSVASLRRLGAPIALERWAAPLNRLASTLDRLGTDCGGMRVSVCGMNEGGEQRRVTWQLIAPDGHGPEIPCMAAIILARRLAQHEPMDAGASACMGYFSLRDFEPEFARWGITWRIEESAV